MPDATIAACHIASLEHPITALADRPPLSAEDLKAYFDANPIQLMHAHNAPVSPLPMSKVPSNRYSSSCPRSPWVRFRTAPSQLSSSLLRSNSSWTPLHSCKQP